MLKQATHPSKTIYHSDVQLSVRYLDRYISTTGLGFQYSAEIYTNELKAGRCDGNDLHLSFGLISFLFHAIIKIGRADNNQFSA